MSQTKSNFAQQTSNALSKASPMCLAIIFKTHVLAQRMTMHDAMQMEFKLCYSFQHDLNSDFYEGIRAAVLDKDKRPIFRHKRVQDVTQHEIEEYFNPKALR